jgi:hypothetical protein
MDERYLETVAYVDSGTLSRLKFIQIPLS